MELSSVADIVSEDAVEPPSIVDLTTGIASPLPEPESTLEPVAETVKESTPEPSLPEPVVKTAPEAPPADCIVDTAPEPTLSTETDVTPLAESDTEIVLESAPTSPELEDPTPTIVIEEATLSTTSTVEETTPPAPVLPEEAIPLTPPPAEEALLSSEPPVVEPATGERTFIIYFLIFQASKCGLPRKFLWNKMEELISLVFLVPEKG